MYNGHTSVHLNLTSNTSVVWTLLCAKNLCFLQLIGLLACYVTNLNQISEAVTQKANQTPGNSECL